jgi:hypothetical protein
LAAVWTRAAGDDAAKVGGIHDDLFTTRAGAPAAAGGAGELESVGLAMAAGPLGHNVCDQNAVVIGGEHRLSTRRTSEIQAVHPRVASLDHIGYVTDGPCFRYIVNDLGSRQASTAYEARKPSASPRPAGPDPMQLGAQLLRREVLALIDLECGQRVDARLSGLLPGPGRAHLARCLEGSREEVRLANDVGDQLAYIPSVQSVGLVQSPACSASTASVTRRYSVSASRIAVGRSIPGCTTLGPGQVAVVMIMRCSSW